MLFILPPSETKRTGGVPGSVLDLSTLSFHTLSKQRRSVVAALVRLSRDREASLAALRISERLAFEVDRNRLVKKSETLPAIERYTGVAYDPIEAGALEDDARRWAARHLAVHSALFGLIGALDAIPAYRLSHDSRLPDISLKNVWAEPIRRVLDDLPGPVVDLRSEAYVELGPAPPTRSVYLRIVSDDGGRRRALNHFNKKTKGALVARLLHTRPSLESIDDFVDWAHGEGITVEPENGRLVVVSETVLGRAPHST